MKKKSFVIYFLLLRHVVMQQFKVGSYWGEEVRDRQIIWWQGLVKARHFKYVWLSHASKQLEIWQLTDKCWKYEIKWIDDICIYFYLLWERLKTPHVSQNDTLLSPIFMAGLWSQYQPFYFALRYLIFLFIFFFFSLLFFFEVAGVKDYTNAYK